MTVLSDKWIKKIAKTKGMIKPFVSKQVRKGKISFGLSSYGYDARVSNEFKIFIKCIFICPFCMPVVINEFIAPKFCASPATATIFINSFPLTIYYILNKLNIKAVHNILSWKTIKTFGISFSCRK